MAASSLRVRKAYDEWAETYDTCDNATRDLNARVLRDAALPLTGRRVLEIGCGTGLNTEYLSQMASEVVGVDLSEEMLAQARRRAAVEHIEFIEADIKEPWAFAEAAFDVIVANLVLEHIEDLSHVVAEAFRVLRTGGIFYIGELHPYRQLRGAQARYERAETGEEVLVEAFMHPVSEYVNEGTDAGFTVQRLGEWQTEDDELPRLLTLLFGKEA